MKTKFITLFFICIATISMAQVNEQDSLALVALYNSTDGSNWTCGCNDGWLSEPVEQWNGITIEDNRVVEIFLFTYDACGLNGILPAEIGHLSQLKKLNILSSVNLHGNLPEEIGLLSNLTDLSIMDCGLEGELPAGFGNLTSLVWARLSMNHFSSINENAFSNLSSLTSFDISQNNITGCFPAGILNLTNLRSLNLSNNNFGGLLPDELVDLTNLRVLGLSNNGFYGILPANLSTLEYLFSLDLSFNQLEGHIPEEYGNFDTLWHTLYLNNNLLLGDVPNSILNNYKLQRIRLDNNMFTSVPDFTAMTYINELKIENNQLTFEDMEPNQLLVSIDEYTYSPQDSINSEIDTTVIVNLSITLETICGGENNQYQWYFNNNSIEGATESTYTLNNVIEANQGVYTCAVTNTVVTGLTLWRKPVTLHVNTSGVEDTNNESIIIEKSGGNLLITNLHDNCNINVYTVEGRLLHSCVGEKDGIVTIDISKFPKGVLILKIVNKNDTFITKKIINC